MIRQMRYQMLFSIPTFTTPIGSGVMIIFKSKIRAPFCSLKTIYFPENKQNQ